MRDRPIIFSGRMVCALLEGRKSQHRIPIKLPMKGEYVNPRIGGWEPTTAGGGGCFTIAKDGSRVPAPEMAAIWNRTTGTCLAAPAQVGDRYWIRESCRAEEPVADCQNGIRFRADDAFAPIRNTSDAADAWLELFHRNGRPSGCWGRFVSSTQMPRWASRLTLLVRDVRVQRLFDLDEADAMAEGCEPCVADKHGAIEPGFEYRVGFARFWNELHGDGSWAANPWVAAITFTVEHRNIDAPPVAEREAAHAPA